MERRVCSSRVRPLEPAEVSEAEATDVTDVTQTTEVPSGEPQGFETSSEAAGWVDLPRWRSLRQRLRRFLK